MWFLLQETMCSLVDFDITEDYTGVPCYMNILLEITEENLDTLVAAKNKLAEGFLFLTIASADAISGGFRY